MNFVIAFLAAALSALGMGGGSILLMYLTAVLGTDQLQAQGINLAFFLPAASAALCFHLKNKLVDIKSAAVFILTGALGVWGGAALAGTLDRGLLGKCFGGLLVAMGIRELFRARH
jgi:uncharacterized membrane protein YfcA